MALSKNHEVRSDRKSVVLGTLAGWLMRLLSMTLRMRVCDESGVGGEEKMPPVIYVLWHNRIFVVPPAWVKLSRGRRECVVLTSASHDGDMVAHAMSVFGLGAVRGSSSRRAVAALVGMKRALRQGNDICLTPDGPRGPRYRVQAGAIKLAESSGAPLVPIHVRFGAAWRLKTWDRFVIPLPFSWVQVTFCKPVHYERGMEAEAFEEARQKLEVLLVDGADDA